MKNEWFLSPTSAESVVTSGRFSCLSFVKISGILFLTFSFSLEKVNAMLTDLAKRKFIWLLGR